MKQQDVFNKIGGIIKEINDQYKYLESNPENLNELELELFVANAHFLADNVDVLNKINSKNNPKQVNTIEQPEKYFEPVVSSQPDNADEPVPEIDLSAGTPEDTYSFEREEPEMIRHELVIDEAEIIGEDEEMEEPAPIIAVEEEKVPVESVAEEKPQPAKKMTDELEEVLTIHQKMAAKHDNSGGFAEQLNELPITDLKPAITLNDKLLYVKDLFNGYSLAYSEAIDILNRFNSFDEADRFLKKNYVVKNNWTDKQETADKFYELLKRRYA